jgi:serine/threonine protein kinase
VPPTKTWEEFETMGAICNIKDKERLANASRLLHALGSIVHFEKEKTLADLVILNPQWLVDVMSTVVTTKHQYSRNGVLQHINLPQIWRAPDFPMELHPTLLHLLEKFEISYYLRSTGTPGDAYSGKSLIPSLLPEERPSNLEQSFARFPAINEQQFARQFHFSFIPHGFVSRLMVRLLHFAEPSVFWRYGILLESERQRILVEANVASRRVDITLRGPGTGKLSQLVIETTNALIDGWYRMNVEVRVPCIHCVRDRMYDPYLFTLEECEAAAIAGHTFVRCSGVRDIRLDVVTPDIAMTHVQDSRLEYSDIEMGKKIGEGGFADVFKSIFRGEIVAVKRIKFGAKNQPTLDDTSEIEAFGEFRREVWIMSGIVHQNCVQLTGFTMDPFCIITEFLHHGNMYDLLHNADFDLTHVFRLRMMHDIAKGMAFLHGTEPPIIHRDLKSPNVLMASLDPAAPTLAKVADFGLSQALASTTSGRSVANPVWLAPEIMRREEYTEKIDVYSYGVMLWEAATRKNYFGEISFMSAIENKVLDGQRPPIPPHCPPAYARLIQACWAGNPDDRPTFVQIKADLLELIRQEAPHLVQVAALEKSGADLRPPRPVTAEQLERERLKRIEEEELLKRQQELSKANSDELARCMVELAPIQSSTVLCLLYIPAESGKAHQVWCGTSSGEITCWDATVCYHSHSLTLSLSHCLTVSLFVVCGTFDL